MSQDHENSIEPAYSAQNPQGTPSQRLWQSVLIAYPYVGTEDLRQSAYVKICGARSFAAGQLTQDRRTWDYITRWVLAGFTPELYYLVNSGLKNAVSQVRAAVVNVVELAEVEERMHRLGILYPNPRRGKAYNRIMGVNNDNGQLELGTEQYPDYVTQLVPEEWADFPARLQFYPPNTALFRHIRGI